MDIVKAGIVLTCLAALMATASACDGCQFDRCYKVKESTSDGKWTCGDDGYMHSKPQPVQCDGCQFDRCYKLDESTSDGKWTCGKDGSMHSKPQPVQCVGCFYKGKCRKVGEVVGQWKCKSDGSMSVYCGKGCYYGRCFKVGEKTDDGKWSCGDDGMMHG